MSLFVGTVSPDGLPAGCRAIAAVSHDEMQSLTIYLPMSTSRDVLANIAATKRLALVGTHPPTHSTMQLKGTTTGVRLAADYEARLVENSLDKFADSLFAIGIPRRITRSINHWPAFAIDMKVEEVFEQTPGPNAGTPIR